MKKSIFLLLLNTLLMFNCALAFPTVRQVMNFDIGDMFHYRVVTGLSGPYLHQTYYIESQELLGKQYNIDSTNVTYQFKRISYQGASENGVWCNMTTDTLSQTYTNLDSSCTSLYANYCTQNSLSLDVSTFTFSEETNSIYQGRTLVDGKKDSNNYVTCVAGLGFAAHNTVGNTRQLVWYKKGNETYGTAIAHLNSPYSTLLTKGQVYDYEVGDVIEKRISYGYTGFPYAYSNTYQQSYKILSRTPVNSDSIDYTVERKRQYLAGDIIDFYFSQDTISLHYGKLNEDIYPGPCYVMVSYTCDSVLINSLHDGNNLTDPRYIKGVGYAYSYASEPGGGNNYYHSEAITYWFKAAENKSCGTFFTFDSLNTDSLLRKRDVFDFAAGDEFQFERQYKNPTYSTYMVEHKILTKTETNTEWTYKIQRKQQFIAGDTLGFYTKSDTIEQVYDKLDDWIAPISNLFPKTYNLCEPLLANYYRNFWQNYYTPRIKDLYIKGLGVYCDTVDRFQEQLTYYHKVSGNTTCGNYFNFALPDTIVPDTIPPTVTITPTALMAYYIPNDNAIKVQIPENEGTSVIEIINFQGQKIYQIEVAPKKTEISIAAQTLESQIYIVRLLAGEKQSYQKISVIK